MLPSFPELLTLAGFTLRGKNRATCAWCTGHDQLTASYTHAYVHCFRCGQTKGYIALARELNLITKTLGDADRAKLREIAEKEKRRTEFNAWQNSKLKIVLKKLDGLNYRSRLAHFVLSSYPEDELAWQALENLYKKEAELFAAFDFFAMTAVSDWLEQESTPEELIALFNEQTRRNR
jgi:hypothetical protein